jgi:hypothetical protein
MQTYSKHIKVNIIIYASVNANGLKYSLLFFLYIRYTKEEANLWKLII